MKLTSSMNTSALFASTSENVEITLGWNAMAAFPGAAEAGETELGWGSMPAFGQAMKGSGNAEEVAEFVRSTPRTAKTGLVHGFWSAIGLRD